MSQASIGGIELTFMDSSRNVVLSLGGASFDSDKASQKAWDSIPTFNGESSFMADLLSIDGDIIEDRAVSAETCEHLLGRKIQVLISQARTQLKAS